MPNSPLISVITPSYMQGEFIDACIKSVKHQSYENIEHLIFDAQSSDNTDAVVKSHLGTYNLYYFSEPDKGQANAINKGLDHAQGDIICWLNSDDLFHNEHVLAKISNLFQKHPQIDIITGGGIYITQDGRWLEDIPVNKKAGSLQFMKRACLTLQPSTFWRKTDLRLDETLHYAFDWKFFLDMLLQQQQFLVIPDKLSQYRMHGESKTFQDSAKRKKEIIRVNEYAANNFMQMSWNRFIYQLFVLAEQKNWPWVKKYANRLNDLLYTLSFGYIYSS
jgi:glycosyltransferase involved in cell wall biosynthesis